MLSLGLTSFLDSTSKYYIKQFAIDSYIFSKLDSSSNIILSGNHYANSIQSGVAVKYSEPNSTTPWAKKLTYSTDTEIYTSLLQGEYDSSGNAYLGFTTGGNTLPYRGGIVKYDTNGNVLWQKMITKNASTSLALYFERNDVDLSGNSYLSGNDFGDTGGPIIVKFNSAGVVQWQRGVRNVSGTSEEFGRSAYGRALIDYQGNIGFSGETAAPGGGASQALIMKCDPSGNILWQRGLYNSYAGYVVVYGHNTDSSGNFYITGYTFIEGYAQQIGIVIKYNSSGSLVWQRGINVEQTRGASVDSSGNVYVVGETTEYDPSASEIFIIKYDANGTVLWQRTLGSPGYTYGRKISIVGDKIYLNGSGLGLGGSGFIAVLPTDGSLTGIYQLAGAQVTYRASNRTSFTTSFTNNTTGRSFDSTPHTVSDATLVSEPFNIAAKYNVNLQ
jgi:hypothetical protein